MARRQKFLNPLATPLSPLSKGRAFCSVDTQVWLKSARDEKTPGRRANEDKRTDVAAIEEQGPSDAKSDEVEEKEKSRACHKEMNDCPEGD